MSTHRQIIADQIKADNPQFAVVAFPNSAPTTVRTGSAYVSVFRESIKPNQNSLESSLKVQVICNAGTTIASEDDLDAALDQVILSIERIPGVLWTEATRAVFDEKYFGYELAVTLSSPNVYKNIVRDEQKAVQP